MGVTLSALCRGVNRHKNSDRATECAMTNVVADLVKIVCHSEDNNILSPKNLLKGLQEDLSLSAQDDKNVFTTKFSGFRRSCIGRSALLCRHKTNFLSNSNNTPSPEFVILTIVRKRLRPLTKGEVLAR